MARQHKKTEYNYASHRGSVPPLPHSSWALTGTRDTSRKLLPHEERQKIAQFWENFDS